MSSTSSSGKKEKKFKPMLAGTIEDPAKDIQFPCYVSPKLDGIRCLKLNGQIVSRSLKPIRNKFVKSILEQYAPEGSDGELIAGSVFQETTSGIMSEDGEPEFTYYIFDLTNIQLGYQLRYLKLINELLNLPQDKLKYFSVVPVFNAPDIDTFLALEKKFLDLGHEGIMTRSIDGPYRFGRSTLKEGYLLKYKRFEDGEAEVIGFEEKMHNDNEAEIDELGHTHRSAKKENLIPMGTLGSFIVRNLKDDKVFNIGSGRGLTKKLRQEIWDNRDQYLGQLVKYRYQVIGTKDAPRIPIFHGFRSKDDM